MPNAPIRSGHVSFRGRLTLFFFIIVIVPMVAIALLMFRLISDSEQGKVNAGISAKQEVVANAFKEEYRRAQRILEGEVARDRVFLSSLQRNQASRASKRARQLVASTERDIDRIAFSGGRVKFDAGDGNAIAAASRDIRIRGEGNLGTLTVSVIDASTFARRMRAATGLHLVVRRGESVLVSTLAGAQAKEIPADGEEVSIGGDDYVAGTFDDGFGSDGVEVATLADPGDAGPEILKNTLIALGILLGFLLAAVASAVLVSKSLQGQILGLLGAARRLGEGDFSAQVPVSNRGHDEFAALGEEFNKMSRQLEARIEELRKERIRVEGAMRRIGEAVAANLDRATLLQLIVQTAVEGVGADAGRVSIRSRDHVVLEELSRVGNMTGLEQAVQSAEAEALRTSDPQETTLGSASAIAHPLRARGDAGVVGVVSIGRSGRSFTHQDRDLFAYLAGQASVSIENVDLHETVARESVTDELTGLSNRRGFDDALTMEIERSRRFGKKLGLVLLDLDDFKEINDTYGHPQGDNVLREVARVLRETSREIDYPARYGGEEMAVLLPETDVEGALRFAERLRERIDGIDLLNGAARLRVTASCGVAAVPDSAVDERGLVAAADSALYEAKRSGKNKSVPAR